MEKRKVLILGAKGMLGQELTRVYGEDEGYEVVAWDRDIYPAPIAHDMEGNITEATKQFERDNRCGVDVTDFVVAEEKIRAFGPAVIVNAVAYNAVDQCEENEEEYVKAMKLNAEVPGFLARLARELDATLIHYSSDYVFDGASESAYPEDAEPNPLSRYGMSKYEGEKRVIAEGGKYYIVRLSKLFGKPAVSATAKKSFFEKMLEVANGKAEVTVVDDEKSCFTYAPDLALASKVLEMYQKPYGIYHLVNEGVVTWYEAAKELFRIAGVDVAVKPVSPDAFPRPAKRPHFSALHNTKFVPLRPYTEALEEFLKG